MRIAVLSDIHANYHALQAVLADCTKQGVDSFWCLGDVIGYGPHPVACVRWLQEHVATDRWVIGNHEAIYGTLLGKADEKGVNGIASKAAELNRQALSQSRDADAFCRSEFVTDRATPLVVENDDRTHVLVHGGQEQPLLRYIYAWDVEFYLQTECRHLQGMAELHGRLPVQWYGHTHIATLVRGEPNEAGGFRIESERIIIDRPYSLDGRLTLANPGSVGQPRDGCRLASYAVLDQEAGCITFRRTAYDWVRTAMDLHAGGYPGQLVARLRDAPLPSDVPYEWRNYHDQISRKLNCHGLP